MAVGVDEGDRFFRDSSGGIQGIVWSACRFYIRIWLEIKSPRRCLCMTPLTVYIALSMHYLMPPRIALRGEATDGGTLFSTKAEAGWGG